MVKNKEVTYSPEIEAMWNYRDSGEPHSVQSQLIQGQVQEETGSRL